MSKRITRKKAAEIEANYPPAIVAIVRGSWEDMVEKTSTLTEQELAQLLELEMLLKHRPSWLERIHPKLGTARREREREEIKNKTWEPST